MKKILVPCDFSVQATNAFRFAIDLATQAKGEIHLIHIVEIPMVHDSAMMPVITYEEALFKDLRSNAYKRFKKLTEKYAAGVKVNSQVIFGPVYRTLLDYIDDASMDLVVMGTKGSSGVHEIFIGSNAENIVRRSKVPVITVKNYINPTRIKNIVFPNTLETKNQDDLVNEVKALQNFFKAKLHIVWVNTPSNFTRDTITKKRLDEFAKKFKFKNFTLNVFNDPYEESGVINFTKDIGADMIAMGTHGRRGIAHVMTGSVAEDIVNHVECPIWTYSIKK